jgi:hypothetical protein
MRLERYFASPLKTGKETEPPSESSPEGACYETLMEFAWPCTVVPSSPISHKTGQNVGSSQCGRTPLHFLWKYPCWYHSGPEPVSLETCRRSVHTGHWRNTSTLVAGCQKCVWNPSSDDCDRFTFYMDRSDIADIDNKSILRCAWCTANEQYYCDSNDNVEYHPEFVRAVETFFPTPCTGPACTRAFRAIVCAGVRPQSYTSSH